MQGKRSVYYMTRSAVIAAAYVVLTLPMAQFAYGPIQFRLAEALTVLAALTPTAIPGLFFGCLLANLLNPQNLGPIDIIGGSAATLGAAWLTWHLKKRFWSSDQNKGRMIRRSLRRAFILSPSVWINALVVGFYLPFIIPDLEVSVSVIALTMVSILVSQAVVVYAVGLPLLIALEHVQPALFGGGS